MSAEIGHKAGDEKSPVSFSYGILESLRNPVCILGADGMPVYGNSAFHQFFKSGKDDVSLDWEHPFFPEYRKRIARSYLSAMKGQEARCFAVINAPDGAHLPVEIYLFPMFDRERVASILALMNFVDNRLLSFDRSTLSIISEENFHYDSMLYEFSPVPMLRLNDKCVVERCSHSAEGFLGCSARDLTGDAAALKSFFIYDSDRIRNAVTDIASGASSFQRIGEVKIAARDGVQKIANLVLFPIVEENEINAVEIIMEDITRLHDLRERVAGMDRINLINNITKGLLHSFNNTINVIMSKTQLLLQITEKEPVVEGIRLIEESSMEIVEQIRRFNNFISRTTVTDAETTERLISVIEDSIEFFRLQFKVEEKDAKRSINVERKYFANVFIHANSKLLREVIVSAILRVSDFIQTKGGIDVTLKENDDLHLVVKVNHGGEEARQYAHAGDMLPGADIRQTAEKIGVKIVEEESAESYSIKIIFPRRLIKDAEEKVKEIEETAFRLRDMDIIVVEDEPALQNILFELFDRMGNRVFICSNGNVALDEYRKKRYDLVITDYGIEGITGIELSARIKEIDETATTILLSGWMIDDIPSYKNIVDLFIPKPFKLDDLIKDIAKVCSEKIKRIGALRKK